MRRSSRHATRLGSIAAMAVWLASTSSWAAPSDAARLFEEGRALMLEGRIEEACPKLDASQRMEPHVGTLLNLAACHEKLGKTSTAWVEYQQALTAARAEGQSEREAFATERIQALEPRVSWVSVIVPSEPPVHGLAVTLDGAPVQPFAWGKDMPIDAGEHVVAASAPDREPWETRFVLRESERRNVTLSALESKAEAPSPPPVEAADQPATAPAAPAVAPRPKEDARSPWSFQLGVMAGYLAASGGRVSPEVEEGSIPLRDNAGTETDCGYVACSYTLDHGGGGMAGLTVAADYELSNAFRVGARAMAGPRFGRGGGGLFALGPHVTFPVGDRLRAGVSGLIAEASVGGYGDVVPPAGHYQAGGGPYVMHSSLGDPAIGAGLELGVVVHRSERGSLGIGVLPLFLHGDNGGSLWLLPVSVFYEL